MLEIQTIPVLSDNYAYVLHDTGSGKIAVVDPPETGPIEAALSASDFGIDWIVITHHHMDHIAAVPALKEKYGCQVVGPAADQHRIPGLDLLVREGDRFQNLGVEKRTNPFLRPDDAGIRAQLGMAGATDAEVFGEIRTRKDNS